MILWEVSLKIIVSLKFFLTMCIVGSNVHMCKGPRARREHHQSLRSVVIGSSKPPHMGARTTLGYSAR